jgi:hypothetical protein
MSCATTIACNSEQRRFAVRRKDQLYGLDYVEVADDQTTLILYFLGRAPPKLDKENIRIDGGRRVTDIKVISLEIHREDETDADDCVHIMVDKPGDFSNYCLCLIEIDPETKQLVAYVDENCNKHYRTMPGFDVRYACLEFTFKANCRGDLDCKPEPVCPPETRLEPEINYLAKDYASFRQLILDRLALIMPDWQERHVPDVGIALVELLAYIGDHLSYYQDAVATEAYLDTARRRTSVRRHVRLVDYQLHEGCNARTWVVFEVAADVKDIIPTDFYLITDPGIPLSGNVVNHNDLPKSLPLPYLVFEPLVEDSKQKLTFYVDHNEIKLYTWGDSQCCLPTGTTAVTLLDPGTATPPDSESTDECPQDATHDHKPRTSPLDTDYRLRLKRCDVIIFEEIKGAKTGNIADADPKHRHAVRLTKAEKSQDPLTGQLIWEVEWSAEDALPFPLCISSTSAVDCLPITDVSVVRANVLLVDHGETVEIELEKVPCKQVLNPCGDDCLPREAIKVPGHFAPYLPKLDITFSQPLLPCETPNPCTNGIKLTPASVLLNQEVQLALPNVMLTEIPNSDDGLTWQPRLDLMASAPKDRHFVVEMEDDRQARLRFGDSELGMKPKADTLFMAKFRIGNGSAGNIGAKSITHIVFKNNLPSGIDIAPLNPLPAMGGINPEPIAEAKLFAPHLFRKRLERAITAEDYTKIVMRDFKDKVQRANAKLQWTGSWFEVLVVIDPLGSETADELLLCEIQNHLYRYRRIHHDVVVMQAKYVPLEVAMTICVLPHNLRGHVKAALLDVFSSRIKADGNKGFFHPDNLTFGEGIYLSKLVAAAQAVEGVESVVVTTLQRQFADPNQELQKGILPLGALEIARLDNDTNFLENGRLTLTMRGGR